MITPSFHHSPAFEVWVHFWHKVVFRRRYALAWGNIIVHFYLDKDPQLKDQKIYGWRTCAIYGVAPHALKPRKARGLVPGTDTSDGSSA